MLYIGYVSFAVPFAFAIAARSTAIDALGALDAPVVQRGLGFR